MDRTRFLAPAAGTLLLTLATSAIAGAPDERSGSVEDTLRAVQAEMQRLREDNQSMRSELDELRAASDDDWVTEQRAEEIRALVYDVLEDADTRASTLNGGMTAGWNDGFFLSSPDGRFLMMIDGQLQFRYIMGRRRQVNAFDQTDRYRDGFEITRSRLTFSGHVFNPDITYLFRTDMTRNEPGLVTGLAFLQDAWIRFQLNNEWGLRIGQFKLPFNREELVSSKYQLAVERSLINENINVGRSQGVELATANATQRFNVAFTDGGEDPFALGRLGDGTSVISVVRDQTNTNAQLGLSDWSFTMRYEHLLAGTWDQFEDLTSPVGESYGAMFGIAGHAQQGEGGTTGEASQWFAGSVDLSFEWGGANAFISLTHHDVETQFNAIGQMDVTGFVAQGGFYITPKAELFARFEYGNFSWDFERRGILGDVIEPKKKTDLGIATIGMNYYIDGHDIKLTTDLGVAWDRIDDVWANAPEQSITGFSTETDGNRRQIIFRAQLQLLF